MWRTVRIRGKEKAMTETTTGRRPRVLVGIDGSPAAQAALEFAVREARMRDATLMAVMAVELPDYMWIDPYMVRTHPEEDTLQRARQELDRMLAAAGTEGLNVDPVVTATPAPQALVDRSPDSDLLVVGSRGHGGLRGLVLGSVSMQCVLHAHCPVTVVHTEPQPRPQVHRTVEEARRETTAAPFF
jgi:nucleotide-binding universal stress UspA family protein